MKAAVTPARSRLGQWPALLRLYSSKVLPRPMQPKGHGEKIWVFVHRKSEQIIYSLKAAMCAQDLEQLPFNGKKTKPAKLRKDYWALMAVIKFPPEHSSVGRCVFQKLRELKHLHEVSWPDELRYKVPSQFSTQDKKRIAEAEAKGKTLRPFRSKYQRGCAINAQKQNAIADMSVVLAGKGKGNTMVHKDANDPENRLIPVSVDWMFDYLKRHAPSWSDNVEHGLLAPPVPEPRLSLEELPTDESRTQEPPTGENRADQVPTEQSKAEQQQQVLAA
ncbi:hypothetical protein CDD82_6881 [Ophiocordyceps australis]|uniref:Large ribosomal subunit protein mL67 n=1 Tax=Ophiocordyceps australis TaxID=1399860 RepID=A0A2C5YT01_9HYPO|nr:hypothetical protein CDD82_6881 [Ophiocordyceps australis]